MESVYNKEQIVQQCVELGFKKEEAEYGFDQSQNKSAEGVIDWICSNNDILQKIANGEIPKIEEKQENQQSQGKSISDMVNQEFNAQLQSLGHSKAVAEKSLFLTQNSSVENALQWIDDHKLDQDYEEELQIIEINEKAKLSDEEAKQKARELQQKLREARIQKETLLAQQQEKDRLKGGKELTQAAREQEEAKIKIAMMEKIRQKKEDEDYKKRLLEEMEMEKKARLGDKYKPKEQKQGTPIGNVELGVKQIQVAHPPNLFPEMAKTALKTILLYLQNIVSDPTAEKYRKINSKNPGFHNRVGQTVGGVYILQNCGFVQQDDFLVMEKVDIEHLKKAIEIISKAVN